MIFKPTRQHIINQVVADMFYHTCSKSLREEDVLDMEPEDANIPILFSCLIISDLR